MDGWSVHKWCWCSFVRTSHPNLAMSVCKGSKHFGSLSRYIYIEGDSRTDRRVVSRSINPSIIPQPNPITQTYTQITHSAQPAVLSESRYPFPNSGGVVPSCTCAPATSWPATGVFLYVPRASAAYPCASPCVGGCGSKVLDGSGGWIKDRLNVTPPCLPAPPPDPPATPPSARAGQQGRG